MARCLAPKRIRAFKRSTSDNVSTVSPATIPSTPDFQQQYQPPFRPRGGDVRMPREPYMPFTRAAKQTCWACGYPNHKASQCAQASKFNLRGTTFSFNRQPKK